MPYYNIAGIRVKMNPLEKTLLTRSDSYLDRTLNKCDFEINIDEEFLLKKQKENPHLSLDECEYLFTGGIFYEKVLNYHAMLLHASALSYKNNAYVFSAPSGTGKSTHANLWKKLFGEDVAIINDDKPLIKHNNGVFTACGTPFSGKTNQNINVCVPLKAICVINRAPENKIVKISTRESLFLLLDQTIRPTNPDQMNKLLSFLDELLKTIPVYKLYCNTDIKAAEIAYNVMGD